MSSPHFLFTCGAWHTPEIWANVRGRLSKAGYQSTAVPLASVEGVNADMTEDVAAIRSVALDLADRGNDIIVVLHSYSGQPGSDAMKGLSKAERSQQGLTGGVVRLVFIMAYIVPEGFQAAKPEDAASAVPPWMQVNLQHGTTSVSVEDAKRIFYNDLSDSDAETWAKKLKPWSIGCAFSTSTYAGWRYIPSTYVLSDQDNSHFGLYANPLLEAAKSAIPTAVDSVENVAAGHCPMISRPDWTAEMLERAVQRCR